MSLKDMAQESLWSRLNRFLDANCGKNWDSVYSQICSMAAAHTYRGRQLRDAVAYAVEMPGQQRISRYCREDYYVDIMGLLQKTPAHKSWRAQFLERKKKAPIEKIIFIGDENIWYELVVSHDGPRASKYTKTSKIWERVTMKVEVDTYPIDPETAARMSIGRNVNLKQGKKTLYKETRVETFTRRACSSKILKLLHKVAARDSQIKYVKITYTNLRDFKGLTAYVVGKGPQQ